MESFYDLGGDVDSVSQVGSDKNSQTTNISYHDIASKLITDKLLLTALELHTELIEAGKELPKLRDFFSNPGNFEFQGRNELTLSIPRSSSQATLDSLDFTRCSEDGERTAEDRVAVLEFELRKANEKINSLRANLTVATECETPTSDGTDGSRSILNEPIKPHEQRALNFLINEYLLVKGYKLTSITFADQNEDQDFEDWDDVGLNIPRPAGLLQLYRAGLRSVSSAQAESTDSSSQTEDSFDFVSLENVIEENKELKEKLLVSQKEKLELVIDSENYEREKEEKLMVSVSSQCEDDHSQNSEFSSCEKLMSSNEKLTNSCEKLVQTEETQTSDPIEVHLTSEAVQAIEEAINNLKNINYNSGFEREVVKELCSTEEWSGPSSVTSEMLIQTLSPTIINIAQSLPINNNKEWLKDIVHLLVHLILLYPNAVQRDNLMQCLLNLKKRPLEDDRNLIVAGLIRVVRSQGSEEIIEAHLLPQCWDLMTNKYPEKRLLVVQICSKIALFISSELRNSLLISVLQQLLLEDKEESVRIGCVHGLAIIAAFLQDPDKYSQLEELTLKSLNDNSDRVCEATLKYLLPVVAKWSLDFDQFTSHLVPSLISLTESQIKADKASCCSGVKGLTSILPHVVISVASDPHILELISQDLPPAQTRVGFSGLCAGLCSPLLFYSPKSEETVGSIMRTFDYCLRENHTWPRLEWLLNTMLPLVLDLIDFVDPAKEVCVLSFINFFKNLCAGFGSYLVQHQVKDIFMNRIDKLESKLMDVSQALPPLTLIPVFVLSLLAPLQVFSGEEVGEWLEKFVVALSMIRAPLYPLHTIFKQACRSSDLIEPVMAALWKGVVHPSSEVKIVSSQLFFDVIPHCSEQIVNGRVVPALITLAADPTLSVRVSTLPTFGLIVEHSNNKEVLDKIRLQIHSVLSDPSLVNDHKSLTSSVISLSKLSPHSEPAFREEVILSNLGRFVERAHQLTNQTCRAELAEALVEAYSNTIYCPISTNTISTSILPALRLLAVICGESLPSHLETVIQMERELDSRSNPTSPSQRSSVSLNLSQSNVEEMKQKMSKIFSSPMSKPNMPNIPNFFKKK